MQTKYNRAKTMSKIGDNHGSFDAMWAHIPATVVEALTSRQLAAMVDGLWDCAGLSKKLACVEAIENGFVWDHNRNVARDLAA